MGLCVSLVGLTRVALGAQVLVGLALFAVAYLAGFAPLAPLALGLGFRLGLSGGLALVVVHMVLGFLAFGLVAAVQQRIGSPIRPTKSASRIP